MQLQCAGIDLSAVITAVGGRFNIDEKELAGISKRREISKARALVGHIATRE
jgi:chromosomal replication initiation ATPase DnaA